MPKNITVEKSFKQVLCGTIAEFKDKHGNTMFFADRVVDNDQFTFYSYGAAELWMKLGGLLHG